MPLAPLLLGAKGRLVMKDQVLMSVPYSPPPATPSTDEAGVLLSKPYCPPPNSVPPVSPSEEAAAATESPPAEDDLALGAIRPASSVALAQDKHNWLQLVPA